MNAMKKAHEIRAAAAKKWNCKVSEIHFGECLKMAHNQSEIEMEAAENGAIKSKSEWAVDHHMVDVRDSKGRAILPNGLGTFWMVPREEIITIKKCQEIAQKIAGATKISINKTDGQTVSYIPTKNVMNIYDKNGTNVYRNDNGIVYTERDLW